MNDVWKEQTGFDSPVLSPAMWWEASDHPLASPTDKNRRLSRLQDLDLLLTSQKPDEMTGETIRSQQNTPKREQELFRKRPTQIQPPSPIRGFVPGSRLVPMAYPTFVCAQCIEQIPPLKPTFMAEDLTFCSAYCRSKGQAAWPALSPASRQAIRRACLEKREELDKQKAAAAAAAAAAAVLVGTTRGLPPGDLALPPSQTSVTSPSHISMRHVALG